MENQEELKQKQNEANEPNALIMKQNEPNEAVTVTGNAIVNVIGNVNAFNKGNFTNRVGKHSICV